jgi:hypothetical protein
MLSEQFGEIREIEKHSDYPQKQGGTLVLQGDAANIVGHDQNDVWTRAFVGAKWLCKNE